MYFSEPVLFDLPVLPRIRKYITVKLQDAAGQPTPFLVSGQGQGAGLFLWAMAQSQKVMLATGWRRQPGDWRTSKPEPIRVPPELTDQIGVGIREFHPSRHQYLLNYAELLVFSNFVDYIILNEMVGHCQAAPEVAPMVRIKQFTDHYDFTEEDLSEGACKQTYLRFRKGTGSFTFNPELVLQTHFQGLMAA